MTQATLKTSEIAAACQKIVADEEIPIKEEAINARSIGWILKRLRFAKAKITHKGPRGWQVPRVSVDRYKIAFGLFLQQEPSVMSKETPPFCKTPPKTPPTPGEGENEVEKDTETEPEIDPETEAANDAD
jgi:hypothetical protein